ncbi:MAG TPA: PQQ-binding-like beta-propeller repeat protein [Nocardioides sp.]|uniref:outer membrane protein assembly factor BamB family protein n=1 Tax=Nocardioides sp. TaxID=35761 RepID=UPI002F410929
MRRLVSVVVPLTCVLAAACSSASPAQSRPDAETSRSAASSPASSPTSRETTRPTSPGQRTGSAFTPWSTYHRTTSRSGHTDHAVGTPLVHAWTKGLGHAVYGEPLLVGSTLIVATEGNRVYGLNARTGHVRWKKSLGTPQPLGGLPCGNIDPLGITSTPAYDAGTGSVFAVAETVGGHHTLWALDAATGAKRWHRSLDLLPDRNRRAEQQRAALLVAHGRVLVSFGGLAGDCDDYVGYVTSTSVKGGGRTFHYAVPTAREGGIWATPGPGLGRNGHVYVAAGNGAEVNGRWDKSDSVTELSGKRLIRRSVFAPATWKDDNANDLDLGSMAPMSVPSVRRIVIAGKRGVVYLLREHFGGVGSAVAGRTGCRAFGGGARVGRTVLMPCLGENQIRALRVGRSELHWTWSADNVFGAPVIAGPRVYVADRYSGDLVVLRLSTGHAIQRIHAGDLPNFPSQIVDGGFVFVPTLTGITAFHD